MVTETEISGMFKLMFALNKYVVADVIEDIFKNSHHSKEWVKHLKSKHLFENLSSLLNDCDTAAQTAIFYWVSKKETGFTVDSIKRTIEICEIH